MYLPHAANEEEYIQECSSWVKGLQMPTVLNGAKFL
jgi:hypothetical protein